MNGSHFHVYALTYHPASVVQAVKKAPKLRQIAFWDAGQPEEFRWVVKQSELLKFTERLLRCQVAEVRVTTIPPRETKAKTGSMREKVSPMRSAWELPHEYF